MDPAFKADFFRIDGFSTGIFGGLNNQTIMSFNGLITAKLFVGDMAW